MIHAAFHLHTLALGAAALISLVALPSEATAKPEIRHSQPPAIAIHRSAMPTAHAFHGTALRGGHRVVSAGRYVGGHRLVSPRTYGANRRYAFGHGHSRRWRGYAYGGAAVAGGIVGESYRYPSYGGGYYSEGYGYPSYGGGYYSEGYGYGYGYPRRHSCRWYVYHDPYDMPYRCRGSYGYSYGYVAPSYGYGYEYGRPYSYRYHAGGAWRGYHRHYAMTGGWRRSTHLAGARVHVHGAPHFIARGGPRFVAHGGPRFVAHGGPRFVAHGGTHMLARPGPHFAGGGGHIRRHGP